MNTLGVRSAIGSANRRKLSFRNVSNVVVQLLHTIKYSVPVPFSHLAAPNPTHMGSSQNATSATGINEINARKVCGDLLARQGYAKTGLPKNLILFHFCFFCWAIFTD